MNRLKRKLNRFLREETAATAVEYAVVIMVIIGVCLTAIQLVGGGGSGFWSDNQNELNDAIDTARQLGGG